MVKKIAKSQFINMLKKVLPRDRERGFVFATTSDSDKEFMAAVNELGWDFSPYSSNLGDSVKCYEISEPSKVRKPDKELLEALSIQAKKLIKKGIKPSLLVLDEDYFNKICPGVRPLEGPLPVYKNVLGHECYIVLTKVHHTLLLFGNETIR